MSLSRRELLRRAESGAAPGAMRRIRALFESPHKMSEKLEPVRTSADATLHLWRTRLITSGLPLLSLNGIRLLVRKLQTLPPDTELEQYGLTGPTFAGNVYFHSSTGEFLGDTIVKHHAKSREMLELDARISHPSRKTA